MLSLLKSLTLLALIGTQVTTAPIPSEITVEPYEQGQIYGKCEREGHIIYDLYTVAGIGWNIKEKDIKYILEGKPSPENRVPRMIKDWQFEEEWENGIQSFALKVRLCAARAFYEPVDF